MLLRMLSPLFTLPRTHPNLYRFFSSFFPAMPCILARVLQPLASHQAPQEGKHENPLLWDLYFSCPDCFPRRNLKKKGVVNNIHNFALLVISL